MSDANTPEYYRRRERQERSFAAVAASANVRAVHLELADRYAELVQEGERAGMRPAMMIAGGLSHAS